MNTNVKIILVSLLAVALIGFGVMRMTPGKKLGSSVSYDVYNFLYGIILGTSNSGGCFKMYDRVGGGVTYVTSTGGALVASTSNTGAGWSTLCAFPSP